MLGLGRWREGRQRQGGGRELGGKGKRWGCRECGRGEGREGKRGGEGGEDGKSKACLL